MSVVAYVLEFLLLIWFLGCVISYRFGNFLLVEGTGVKGVEFIWFVIYLVSLFVRILVPIVGNWVVLGFLVLWLVIQYFCHWHYTLFGASPQKIKGYNQCFEGTFRIIPQREDKLIPDFYHIVLHGLIIANIITLCGVLIKAG